MICSICNQFKVIPIWYGYPTKVEIDLANNEQIVLGGPNNKGYTHYCYYCNEAIVIQYKGDLDVF